MDTREEIKQRLSDGVGEVDETTGCWIWRHPTNRDRGQIRVNKKTHLACRVTWEVYRGEIPDGMHVLHRCDNPRCVNPDHLWLGTHADNMADKAAKGRAYRSPGETHPMAKLTNEQAIEIYRLARSGGHTWEEIGAMFGIGYSTVGKILNGDQWSSVTGAVKRR